MCVLTTAGRVKFRLYWLINLIKTYNITLYSPHTHTWMSDRRTWRTSPCWNSRRCRWRRCWWRARCRRRRGGGTRWRWGGRRTASRRRRPDDGGRRTSTSCWRCTGRPLVARRWWAGRQASWTEVRRTTRNRRRSTEARPPSLEVDEFWTKHVQFQLQKSKPRSIRQRRNFKFWPPPCRNQHV